LDDWFNDLNKRLATINIRQEEAELATLEARLNQVLSPEERRRIEVEMLAKELG
jgi:2-phospho-L-lactate guanylyltransferase (CobY/MobA/RfbA family)